MSSFSSNNGNTCTVSGLSCPYGDETAAGTKPSDLVEHHVWTECPPINFLQESSQSCEPSLECVYDTTPKDPCDLDKGFNTETVTCSSSGDFPQLPIYDYCCGCGLVSF